MTYAVPIALKMVASIAENDVLFWMLLFRLVICCCLFDFRRLLIGNVVDDGRLA